MYVSLKYAWPLFLSGEGSKSFFKLSFKTDISKKKKKKVFEFWLYKKNKMEKKLVNFLV